VITIIEGPDGLGKSTLCRVLSEWNGSLVYKANSMRGLELSSAFMAGHDEGSLDMAILAGGEIILDRSFPSAIAYDYAFDREPMSRELYDSLDSRAALHGVVGIMLLPLSSGHDVAVQRGVDDIPEWAWNRLVSGYNDYLEWSRMEWSVIDGTAPFAEVLDAAKRRLR